MTKTTNEYTENGYLQIKANNQYVNGVVGTDIKLSFLQKNKNSV